jgi:hypothetical protein
MDCAKPAPRCGHFRSTIQLLVFVWLAWTGIVVPLETSGQNLLDRAELGKYDRKLESFRNQYQRAARRDPSNEGAKTIARLLDTLRSDLNSYSKEKLPKRQVMAALEVVVREASRYSTPQAQKTVKLLGELANFLKTQPDLDYLLPPIPKSVEQQPSPKPVAPAQSASAPDLSQKPESATPIASEAAVDELSVGTDTMRPYEKTEETLTWEVVLLWIIVACLLVGLVLLYRKLTAMSRVISEQQKSLQQQLLSLDFKQAGQAAAAGSGDYLEVVRKDFNKRMDRIEQNTAEFLQLLETRLQKLEQTEGANRSEANPSHPNDLPDFVLQNYEQRIAALENRIRIGLSSSEPVPVLSHLPAHVHLEAIYEALSQIKRQSNLKSLTDRVQWLAEQMKRAEHQRLPDLIELHLAADVIQLAYVAAYNEQLDEPYEALLLAFAPLGLVPEPSQVGDHLLPADVAANIPFDRYKQEPRFLDESMPNRPTVLRQIEKRWPEGSPPAGVVAQVLQPSVWFQARQPRILLAKGQYVVG